MIIVERILESVFDALPLSKDYSGDEYKVRYEWGDELELQRFLDDKSKSETNSYPLIWVVTPIKVTGQYRKQSKLKIVLAINTESSYYNRDRLKITIEPTLEPLYSNVIKAINHEKGLEIISRDNENYSVHYNYGVKLKGGKDKEHPVTDIWDAITFNCELQITKSQCENYY